MTNGPLTPEASQAAKVPLASLDAGPGHAVDGGQAGQSDRALFQPDPPPPSTTKVVPLPY
ncbi:hypothetical protein AB0I10_21295 [Streptomyces sp. NPDC050636]|uniref:hypothetical protein n=1 Tax=Streptomyces sp. NPDC050636 TaxID=3154510 RepID=UPI00343A3238